MQTRFRCLSMLLACVLMTAVVFWGCSTQQRDNAAKTSNARQAISDSERALAMLEVQNTFSKHAFYHQAGKHCEEIADIWVAENGPNAKTAVWTLSGNMMEGIEVIKDEYCTKHLESQKKSLEELSQTVPSIKNIPENIGAGSEYVMHTQETPVIEVAGDGKTAKGLWYSIGQSVRGRIDASGNSSVSTGWMWEKYGVDFIKEDGKWKIWHLINLMDQGPVDSGLQAQGRSGGAPGGRGGARSGQGGGNASSKFKRKTPENFKYSPTAVLRIDPPFPEPYYTFGETFSY
jgi:hypothetical protein